MKRLESLEIPTFIKAYGGLIDSNDLRDTIISNNLTTSNINFGELVNTPVVSLPEWVSWESTIKRILRKDLVI